MQKRKETLKANKALVDLLGSIAQRKKATPAQIALAWLRAKALDCSDPGYDEDEPSGRKHRSGVDPTDARESGGNRCRRVEDRRSRWKEIGIRNAWRK
jgi:hypothetical protein